MMLENIPYHIMAELKSTPIRAAQYTVFKFSATEHETEVAYSYYNCMNKKNVHALKTFTIMFINVTMPTSMLY